MQVSTCPDLNELKKLVSGRLPPPDVETLIQHLETCPTCFAKVPALAAKPTLWWNCSPRPKLRPPVGKIPSSSRLIARLMQLRKAPEPGPQDAHFPLPRLRQEHEGRRRAGRQKAQMPQLCPGDRACRPRPSKPPGQPRRRKNAAAARPPSRQRLRSSRASRYRASHAAARPPNHSLSWPPPSSPTNSAGWETTASSRSWAPAAWASSSWPRTRCCTARSP